MTVGLPVACGPSPTETRYLDLVTGDPTSSAVSCGDRHRYSLTFAEGEVRDFPLPALAETATLLVDACAANVPRSDELRLRIGFPEARSSERQAESEIEIPLGGRRWERRRLRVPVGAGMLRVSAPERAGRVHVAELVVESRVPRPRRLLRGEPPQLLLVSVDTLREDAIGALGGRWPTPRLDSLIARSQAFRPHYAAATWTKPSHASLLTGEYPLVHGANGFEDGIAAGVRTLAERLDDAGFATGGLVHHVWLSPKTGFARGFHDFRVEDWDADQQIRWALNWIGEHRNQPFFFFLHLMEAHSDFRQLPYESSTATRDAVRRQHGVARYGCRKGLCASSLLGAIGRGEVDPLPNEASILEDLYHRGIADLDASLGTLLNGLGELGVLDNLILVLTSDHGEALLEDGRSTTHGNTPEETLRVPLSIKWPGDRRGGELVGEPSSALDLVPTLLEATGQPSSRLPGRSLVTGRRGRPIFVGSGRTEVVIDGDYKAIFEPRSRPALFDLESDPKARRDVAEQHPEVVARLRELVDRHRRATRQRAEELGALTAAGVATLSDEERDKLRALGYVAGDPALEGGR